MTKPEIVQQVLNDFRDESEGAHFRERSDVDYEPIILPALEKSLQTVGPDTDIRTCADFGLLKVTCYESCHGLFKLCEMLPVEIESAGNAWKCCTLDRAHSPAKFANLYHLPQHMTFNELLTAFMRRSEDV